MTAQEPFDVETAMRGLPVYDAQSDRAERIRRRCVAAIEAKRPRARTRGDRMAAWAARLEPVAAVALSALYLAAAVQASLVLLPFGRG